MTNGPAFYDDDQVFATYMRHRQRPDTPNDTLERPIIMELIGTVAGLDILDLGCGDAMFGRELLERGAASYLGVEGSYRMAEAAAHTLAGSHGLIVRQTLEEYSYPRATFDLIVARLVLHYIADLSPLFVQIYQALRPSGQFVFSVEHPVITSCDRGWAAGGLRQDWIVDNYFAAGLRETDWLGGHARKYHRTVEDYFAGLQRAGFVVERLRESSPQREHFQDAATYERRKRIPLFLLLTGRKPAVLASNE